MPTGGEPRAAEQHRYRADGPPPVAGQALGPARPHEQVLAPVAQELDAHRQLCEQLARAAG